jgi:hypothetical protein
MSYISFVPPVLLALEKRSAFLDWLRSMPVTFHARLRIYFDWLDLNAVDYTADEIDSLKTPEKTADAAAAQ